MNQVYYLCKLEIRENLRARWYQLYILSVALTISILFFFGLVESRTMGFLGLGRSLLTLVQVSIILLPIFTLITTVRTFVGDRDAGLWEYNLSVPVRLSSFYWGKCIGRFLTLYLPLLFGLGLGIFVSIAKGITIPWKIFILYEVFIGANLLCFTGIALCLSIYSKNQEVALGISFVIWLISEALIDSLLLGLLLKQRISGGTVLTIAFFNPLQTFRMASIALFDPELTVLGPIAYTIVEKVGTGSLIIWNIFWSSFVGIIFSLIGYRRFIKRDLI